MKPENKEKQETKAEKPEEKVEEQNGKVAEIAKEVIETEEVEMTREEKIKAAEKERLASWKPKTKIGKLVKEGKITNIDEILDKYKILESEIVDYLLDLKTDLLAIGQAKGKFGGGKRRVWKQTQKKTAEGNVPTFSCMVVVGDGNGHVGLGHGKSKETLPAREKAIRNSKLNIIKVDRGCSSFDCLCNEPHTVPFQVTGKCGSCIVILKPAPQGTGLVIGNECKKILRLAGVKDVFSKTFGQTRTTINLAKACVEALKNTRRQK